MSGIKTDAHNYIVFIIESVDLLLQLRSFAKQVEDIMKITSNLNPPIEIENSKVGKVVSNWITIIPMTYPKIWVYRSRDNSCTNRAWDSITVSPS
jgi:hypothetical protein